MFNNLIVASALALALAPTLACARSPMKPSPVQPDVIFQIDHRLKADVDLNEWHFELHADGNWKYIETSKQAIKMTGTGRYSRSVMAMIRADLSAAPWRVSHADLACMAYAVANTQYSVDGKHVWTDEMCSVDRLDPKSTKRLANVMELAVTHTLASMVK